MAGDLRSLVCIVPIRAGSKGLPGKNTRLFCGLPLYMHAVHQGLRTVGRVVVSTDIEDVLSADLPTGCVAIRRPPELATDQAAMADVIAHAIKTQGLSEDVLVLLQATSPLRRDEDIRAAIALFEGGMYDMVMTVTARNSGVLKYGTLSKGRLLPMRDPAYCFANRQALPPVFGPNGAVYVFAASEFLRRGGFPSASIGAVEMPCEYSADIDALDDVLVSEELYKRAHCRR